MKKLIMITGPTAVGKTEVAIHVAEYFRTEIISADSRQFYREMVIGTACPSESQLKRVKHHFIGNLSIHDTYNVSMFEQEALVLLDILFRKHNMVVITGGSGLYLKVLEKGIDDLPDIEPLIREELKKHFNEKGLGWLQEEVKRIDPAYYSMADRKNPKRLLRALEIYHATGKKFSELRRAEIKQRKFQILKIGLTLPKDELLTRIDERLEVMMTSGLVKECEKLFPFRHLNALNTVGYKEIFTFLEGRCTLEGACDKIRINTRKYAKRQLTWLRRDKDIIWFHPDECQKMVKYIKEQSALLHV